MKGFLIAHTVIPLDWRRTRPYLFDGTLLLFSLVGIALAERGTQATRKNFNIVQKSVFGQPIVYHKNERNWKSCLFSYLMFADLKITKQQYIKFKRNKSAFLNLSKTLRY